MNWKTFKRNIIIFWRSIFRGMASADAAIESPVNPGEDVSVTQQVKLGGVYSDFLQGKETQRVKEARDKYYRVVREADKYKVDLQWNENGDLSATARKKTAADFTRHVEVYNPSNLTIRTIQDNKHIQSKKTLFDGKDAVFEEDAAPTGIYDYETTLTITRNGFEPRFRLEKFVKKIVVRKSEGDDRWYVDLYLPAEASQFGKIDAMLIANLHQMKDSDNLNGDITDFSTIEWYSDKAWNAEDFLHFKYDDPIPVSLEIYDGSFVLTYSCNAVFDGKDFTEKYKTKELTEKYETKAPKHDGIDIFTLNRHIKQEQEKESPIDFDNM